jgi:voltage-gated potassium channel
MPPGIRNIPIRCSVVIGVDGGIADERFIEWDRRTRWVIIVAAIAPMVTAAALGNRVTWLQTAVDFASWGIFVVDLVVRVGIVRRYIRTFTGLFDLAIVVLTFPWYIFPGVGGLQFMSVFRTARLIRLLAAVRVGHRALVAFRRLGRLGIWLVAVSFLAAIIVLQAEPPESGFETFGDALWWALVSFTTVGYGDFYPVTPLGRMAGAMMMFVGLAALGTVAAVFGSVFMGADDEDEEAPDQQMLRELRALRSEVAELRDRLDDD